ncbi:hypothetical protein FJZ55_07615, partial [Candidatus Woesearchaeota archaeon]|nr:hypothetical protein [Candidatus Woesearchaeota archaeon]
MIEPKRQWTCEGCGRRIDAPLDSNEPTVCEKCGSTALHPAFSGMSIERIVQRVHQEIRTSMLGPQSSVPASWKPGDPLFSSEAGALVSAIAKSEPAPQSQTFTMNGHTDPRLVTYFGPNSDAADSFKELRARIFLSTNGLLRRTILITSPKSSTGVTTVASNLSVAIAQTLDAHALCLEVNYRRPAMLRTFGLDQNRP